MIKKIFIKVKKPKGYKVTKKPGLKLKKYKPQSKPPSRDPYMEMIQSGKDDKIIRKALGTGQDPTKVPIVSLRQEQITKVARRFEEVKSKSNIRKVRSAIKRKYKSIGNINDPIKRNQAKRLEIKAFTSAQKFASKKLNKMSKKYGVGVRRFGSKKTSSKGIMTEEQGQKLGFAPKEPLTPGRKEMFAKSKKQQDSLFNNVFKVTEKSLGGKQQKPGIRKGFVILRPKKNVYYDSASGMFKQRKKRK